MLKKQVKLYVIFLVLFLLQFSCFPFFAVNGAMPDLLSILVVFYALYVKKQRLLLLALVVGLCNDVFSSNYFGVGMAGIWLTAHFLYFLVRKFPQEHLVGRVLLIGVFTASYQIIVLLLMAVFDHSFRSWEFLTTTTLPCMLYTMACAFILVPLLKTIMKDSLRQYNLF
jgi:rod shape-determining protein MreD